MVNTAYFIAKKVIANPSHSFSKLIIRIAIVAVALGLTVMIVAASLIAGFKHEVSHKIFGFWGHIHVTHFQASGANPYEAEAVSHRHLLTDLAQNERFEYPCEGQGLLSGDGPCETRGGIAHIQSYAQKIGVIKTRDEIEGIILKGLGTDFNWNSLQNFIRQGDTLSTKAPEAERDIILSEQTAKRLALDIGDYLLIYFVKGEAQLKKRFQVSGIYKTGLEEYDTRFALVDIRHIQALNDWDSTEVSGYEIFIDDIRDLNPLREIIYEELPLDLYATTIEDINPNIFSWLRLQDTNEKVILSMMVIVGLLTMVTALIILILEHTNMVGVLKALGAPNITVQKVFLYYGAYITLVGLFWGNMLGLGLCFLQDTFGIIQLPEEDYYVSVAPIRFQPLYILAMNIGVLLVTVLVLIIPSVLVRHIDPVKAIRFK